MLQDIKVRTKFFAARYWPNNSLEQFLVIPIMS